MARRDSKPPSPYTGINLGVGLGGGLGEVYLIILIFIVFVYKKNEFFLVVIWKENDGI